MNTARMRRLPREFFSRPTLTVARDLLGKLVVRRVGRMTRVYRITEVEAYRGEEDRACHASHGRTRRTDTLYGRPGIAYVYLIYGMYHCLNVVTEKKDFPAAVLIRSCVSISQKMPARVLTGPGRLCRALQISRALNGTDVTQSSALWFADDRSMVSRSDVRRTPRIGVAYAGDCACWPWRFVLREEGTPAKQQRARRR